MDLLEQLIAMTLMAQNKVPEGLQPPTPYDPDTETDFAQVPEQYRSLIQGASQQHGVPAAILAGLLKQESGFNPNAKSPVGASGIAQFMPGTAKQFGINPLDPNQAIPAAAKYLSQNYAKGGNWENALAGYNAGPGRMDPKVWGRIGETANYVPAVMGHARGYGYGAGNPAPVVQNTRQEPTLNNEMLIRMLLGSL